MEMSKDKKWVVKVFGSHYIDWNYELTRDRSKAQEYNKKIFAVELGNQAMLWHSNWKPIMVVQE